MALSPRDRRALMILLPVLVVAVAFYILTSGSKKDSASSALPPGPGMVPGVVTSPTPQPSPSPSPSANEMLVFSGRDPFQNPFGASLVSSSSPLPSTTPTPSVSPAGSPPSTPTGGSSTTSGGHTVVLVDVFSNSTKAQVEVDGTVYTVGEGDTFASTFKLVTISGNCASFLNGDSSFSLCETANK
jgi:hypothetical protein